MFNRLLRSFGPKKVFQHANELTVWLQSYVDVRAIPYKISLCAYDNGEEFLLTCQFSTIDNVHKSEIRLKTQENFPRPASIVDVVRAVRALLIRVLIHELDEAILIDGFRVFDPHNENTIVSDMKITNTHVEVGYHGNPPIRYVPVV